MIHKIIFALLLLICTPGSEPVMALQPIDISALGDFRAFTQNLNEAAGQNHLNFHFNELEIALQGYLNPFARGDIIVSSGGDNFDIEEAYATILRGLPLNLNIKAGHYLVDFGKLNSEHAHVWPFVERPQSHTVLMGEEGFQDDGVNISTAIPLGSVYSKISLNILSGSSLAEEGTERGSDKPIFCGRYSLFFPVSEHSNVEMGVSGLNGIYAGKDLEKADGHNLEVTMASADFKYKYRPSDYTSFVLRAEAIFNRRDILEVDGVGTTTNSAGFAYATYHFHKRYNIGCLVDYAPGVGAESFEVPVAAAKLLAYEQSGPVGSRLDNKNRTVEVTGFLGFALMEETTMIRLAGKYTKFNIDDSSLLPEGFGDTKNSEFQVLLQLIFSMGPHRVHEF